LLYNVSKNVSLQDFLSYEIEGVKAKNTVQSEAKKLSFRKRDKKEADCKNTETPNTALVRLKKMCTLHVYEKKKRSFEK